MMTSQSRVMVFLVWLVTFVAYSVAYTTFGSSIAVLAQVLALGPIEIGDTFSMTTRTYPAV